MKDILFLIPLYYTSNSVERIQNYIQEATGNFSYDIYFCCTNPDIFEEAKRKCNDHSSIDLRENIGVGQGMCWFLQEKAKLDLNQYKYIWYFEESCEPIRRDWVEKTLQKMNSGWKLCGWDWNSQGKKRKFQIRHEILGAENSKCVAFENTEETGVDIIGKPLKGLWDTPAYRHESIVFHSKDFNNFKFPDPNDSLWVEKGGWRSYGTRAERMWWDLAHKDSHGHYLKSPNLQWEVISKYKFVPPEKNEFFWYYRELNNVEKTSSGYVPPGYPLRKIAALNTYFKLRTKHIMRKVLSACQ